MISPQQTLFSVVKVDTLVLFLILGGIQFFTIENNVCCRLVIWGLYYVEVGSFYAHFLKTFNHKWVLNFVKGFPCICWDYHMAFTFQFVNTVYHIDWFLCILKNPCIPETKPTWSWCISVLMFCWILFAKILLRIFTSRFINDIILWFSFLCCLCLVLVSGWWWSYRMGLEVFRPLQFFERVLEG